MPPRFDLLDRPLLSLIIARFCEEFSKDQVYVCLSNDVPENDYPHYDIVFTLKNDFPVLTSRRPAEVFKLKIHREDAAARVKEVLVS